MPLIVWGRDYDQPSLDELARWTAEDLARKQREEQRAALARELRPLLYAALPGGWHWGSRGFACDFDIEECWSANADEPDFGRLRLSCPGCRRRIAPFRSRSLTYIDGGWRWVGLDYQEPYSDYFVACGWCGEPIKFSTHCPQ